MTDFPYDTTGIDPNYHRPTHTASIVVTTCWPLDGPSVAEDLPPWTCPACSKGNGPKTTYCRHCAGETGHLTVGLSEGGIG